MVCSFGNIHATLTVRRSALIRKLKDSLSFPVSLGVTSSLKSDCPVVEGVAGEASVVILVSL